MKWFAGAWLPITELTCYLLLAIAVFFWVQPPLSETTTLSFDWIVALWIRNLALMGLMATGLHLWLYTWRKQGNAFRHMRQDPTEKSNRFLGGSQLQDNVFWTLASGVTMWSLYET